MRFGNNYTLRILLNIFNTLCFVYPASAQTISPIDVDQARREAERAAAERASRQVGEIVGDAGPRAPAMGAIPEGEAPCFRIRTIVVNGATHSRLTFFERRKFPKFFGSVAPRFGVNNGMAHSKINFEEEYRDIDAIRQVRFLKRICVELDADFGCIEVLTPEYREIGSKSGAALWGAFRISTHLLRVWLPDIFWATVLGPPYVALFGKDCLLNAPAAVVEELAPDLIYVQLTDNLADTVNDPFGTMERRQAFKDHVGMDAFYDPSLGIEYEDLNDYPPLAKADRPIRRLPAFDFTIG